MNKRLFIQACKSVLNDETESLCPAIEMYDRWDAWVTHHECKDFFKVKGNFCPCEYYQNIKKMSPEKAKANMLKIIAKSEGKK